jgi:hypothetical protein
MSSHCMQSAAACSAGSKTRVSERTRAPMVVSIFYADNKLQDRVVRREKRLFEDH